jgi:acyl-homoserine-lactone acylase
MKPNDQNISPGRRKTWLILAALTISGLSALPQNKGGEILWDHDGVPHIYGANEREMYYAFGWAQMHNHANLILQLYAQARGRAAEYFGEAYLPLDKKIRLFNVPEQALKWIK